MIHLNERLDKAVSGLSKLEEVSAVMIFGSYTSLTRPRDIDVMIVLKGDSANPFVTNHSSYLDIAEVLMNNPTFPKIDPLIKSMGEFNERNVVSIPKGFLQHWNNMGYLVYDNDSGLEQKIKDRYGENKTVRGYWNELDGSLSIRKSCIAKMMDEPYELSMKFYQQAVREVFGLEFPAELDNRKDIVDLFYSELFERSETAFEVAPEFIAYAVQNAFDFENPFILKDEIEKAMHALNKIYAKQHL